MKRIKVVLSVVCLLLLAQAAFAVNLKAGWYASLDSPYVYGDDGQGYTTMTAWGEFTTPGGSYGPFDISEGAYGSDTSRRIAVSKNAPGVGPDQSLVLPMQFNMNIGDYIAYITFGWRTVYDANSMYVELWRERLGGNQELVWSQHASGDHSAYVQTANNILYEGAFYYKIVVVPEPCSLTATLTLLSLAGTALLRRRAM